MKIKRAAGFIIAIVFVLLSALPAQAEDAALVGFWQYQEMLPAEASETLATADETVQTVLLADMESMPLNLLGKVFGKLAYTVAFTKDDRFDIQIKVMGMRFAAQGSWSVQDGSITLVYDTITGFEKLRWLGSFNHLLDCDAEHTMTETVPYAIAEDTLTFYSNGADVVFVRE
ncbi:MAG TPA: hypothetical protein PK537_10585 [Candidatus Limiplasma sp.]|nr:hypothetical protein [Candidatus Limiplasma sp.]